MSLTYDPEHALAHLQHSDPALADLIDRAGDFGLVTREPVTVFRGIARAIVGQQLSNRAADTIRGRLESAADGGLTPQWVMQSDDDVLRAAGLSQAKVRALRDLALHAADGRMPERRAMATMSDEAILTTLTKIRGIGPWTVHMLLLFDLGRPDVFPTADLGIRKGLMALDGLETLPTPQAMTTRAEPWRPYRSVASWYLWRAAAGV